MNELPDKLLKPYDPATEEARLYKAWEKSGYFTPERMIADGYTAEGAPPYTIIMPPPNVTGILHMGHALMLTVQDILIRYKRMRGFRTLWLPGTDHAAIATQSTVEKKILKEEKLSRHDLGRDAFLTRVTTFAQESHDTIASQIRVMGASCDWSREAFTLDEPRTKAVRTMFKKMYDDGLIYRGHRIVNWDPKGQTTISDDEIVYEARKATLYTFKYSKDFPLSISTTRPETKVGDVAVAVHPSDERYREYVGKEYRVVFAGVPLQIKIIADESVEKDFGTGALGVTPAHSMTDWEIADRHGLERPQVINEYAKLTVGDERILGKKTVDARDAIVEWLRNEGLLEKEEIIEQNIATAERTGGIVEPLPKLQWFINVNKPIPDRGNKTLKELMREPVAQGEIAIVPDYFTKTYFHWIDNLRDWCISRQIWYGHRIPVWYDPAGNIHLPKEKRVIFIRHGESTANELHVYDGQGDSPLTENGKIQAQKVANELKDKGVMKIFSSDLYRAKETAEIIAKELQIKNISFHSDLQEVSAGNLKGQPVNQGPILIATLQNNTGETAQEMVARAKKAWNIIKASEEETIAIVGHQSFLSVMKSVVDGVEETAEGLIEYRKKWKVANAGIYEFNILIEPEGDNFKQDEDTLDTWFSSALWTFSTLGWPEKTEDLSLYHPTDVLETGYEILFFWVARMILMSEYAIGDIPFRHVYLHGTVRDGKGVKMSKSLGNGIDPLDIAQKYGADAGRMALILGTAPGTDSKISEDKIKGQKHFANKLWNITRFVLTNYTEGTTTYTAEDQLLLEEWKEMAKAVTNDIEHFRLHTASEALYHYIWTRFADEILEGSKSIFMGEDAEAKSSRQTLLLELLTNSLTLLHPFMPFVTEALWELLPIQQKRPFIMIAPWPIM